MTSPASTMMSARRRRTSGRGLDSSPWAPMKAGLAPPDEDHDEHPSLPDMRSNNLDRAGDELSQLRPGRRSVEADLRWRRVGRGLALYLRHLPI